VFERSELEILKKRIEEPRKFIQILTGPRQVGKTTLLSQLTGKLDIPSLFESADAVAAANTLWLEQVWELFYFRIPSK
jgi:uncharacterized protein